MTDATYMIESTAAFLERDRPAANLIFGRMWSFRVWALAPFAFQCAILVWSLTAPSRANGGERG